MLLSDWLAKVAKDLDLSRTTSKDVCLDLQASLGLVTHALLEGPDRELMNLAMRDLLRSLVMLTLVERECDGFHKLATDLLREYEE